MEMDFEDKKPCRDIKVDGFIEKGKQFDLEITLPEDNRNVIYGVIKDCYKEPVEDAVVEPCADDADGHRPQNEIQRIVTGHAEVLGTVHHVQHRQQKAHGDDDAVPVDVLSEHGERNGAGVYRDPQIRESDGRR